MSIAGKPIGNNSKRLFCNDSQGDDDGGGDGYLIILFLFILL